MTNSLIPTASYGIYFLKFALMIGLVVFPAGALAIRLFKPPLHSRLEFVLTALVAGTLASNSIYFSLRFTHHTSWMWAVFVSILAAYMLSAGFRPAGRFTWFRRPSNTAWTLAAILIAIAFYHFHRTWQGVSWTPDGGLLFREGFYADPIWKLAVASELEHSVPPQMPIFPDVRLTYHYFMELFTVFIHDMTRIDLIALRFFIVPLHSYFVTGLALFAAFRLFLGNAQMALVSVALILVHGTGCVEDAHIPFAISAFLTVILLMSRSLEEKGRTPWILIVLIIGHGMLYEAIVSATFMAGLSLSVFLIWIWRKRAEPFFTVAAGGVLMIAAQHLAVGRMAGGNGHSIIGIQFPFFVGAGKDFGPFKEALRALLPAYGAPSFADWGSGEFLRAAGLPFLGVIAVMLFAFRIHGIGLMVLPLFLKKIKNLARESTAMMLILPTLIFGLVFPLVFSFPFLWAASFRILFNTVYILIGFVPFAADAMWKKSRYHRVAVCVAFLLLFVWPAAKSQIVFGQQASWYGEVSGDEMKIFNYLRTQTPTDAVLMHPFIDHDIRDLDRGGEVAWVFKDHYYFGSALGGRRVVLEGSKQGIIKESTRLTQAEIDAIMADIASVYATSDSGEAAAILKKYRATHLWVPSDQPLRFNAAGILKPVAVAGNHALYQVMA